MQMKVKEGASPHPRRQVIHCAETVAGGIASYLRDLLPLQVQAYGAGAVSIVVPASQCHHIPPVQGVTVHLYIDTASRVLNAFRLAVKVRQVASGQTTPVIHMHSTFAGAILRPVLTIFSPSCARVYCAHGWAFDREMSALGTRLVKWTERVLASFCDAIVCISQHDLTAAKANGLPPKILHLVRNGIASEAAAPASLAIPWKADKVRLLFIGRFDKQKGLDVFLAALELLGERAQGAVAGGAVLKDGTTTELPSNVIALGWLGPDKLEAALQSAHALVVPSRWEGFGLIAAEAMRASRAVLASNVGGLSEVVEDGVTGILFAPGSSKALTNAVCSVDAATLVAMGIQGRKRFELNFQMNRVQQELDAIYSKVTQH